MNLYAEILNENEFDVPLEKRYGILCRLIADNPHATKEDLVALTTEYKNLKGRYEYEPIRAAVSE